MKQCGVVTEVKGQHAKVVMQRHSSCGSCNACKMGEEENKFAIEAINGINAKIGDRVSVDMESQDVLSAAFIVYVIPLIALLVGIFAGNRILVSMNIGPQKDIYVAIIGFAVMALTFLAIRTKEGAFKESKKFLPVITEIVETNE
ncbi:SoxR reducing system RseC family protein [Alkaliphilus serpentinus]|uniref:SoxR reducing system RseC family protein n=1 Tax=Alkaliphilus serpentinus TaxID=1482731 RepID=A0A833HMI8_9FIRM|nr:SoxR reducing system RseC family protein [Alkaliphilus serpentinus]KAB3527660.1 SoxR reducing system RseC family protein [Alkaliphilus serpentinus]